MIIRNLVEDFISIYESPEKNWEDYKQLYPELFDHYFRFWCPHSWENKVYDTDELRIKARRVTQALDSIAAKFSESQLDIDDLQVVLLVGADTSNGHAFLDRGKCVIWLPVETYTTDLLAKVFITHEFAHGLHYSMTPDFSSLGTVRTAVSG